MKIITEAVMGILPHASAMTGHGGGNATRLTDPEEIGRFFDVLGATREDG